MRLSLAFVGVVAVGCWLPGSASALPIGWTCVGACGTLGADGVVTTPPGGGTYEYVTSNGGVGLGTGDLNAGSETNGTILTTNLFSASASDVLSFNFNFVTSDGAGFSDYAWARLLDSVGTPVDLIFTARTTTSGNTVPGFGLPAISGSTTLTPASSAIIPGGPAWSPLGGSSSTCYDAGCGYTGWIEAQTIISTAGSYRLEFGVVNWIDEAYDTGLAIKGTTVDGVDIQSEAAVPEPGTLLLLGAGILAAVAGRARARRRSA